MNFDGFAAQQGNLYKNYYAPLKISVEHIFVSLSLTYIFLL